MKQDRNGGIWTFNYVVYTNDRKMDVTLSHPASSEAGATLVVRITSVELVRYSLS